MTDARGGIVPARWVLPAIPTYTVQIIIVDWLYRELPAPATIASDLERLKGWRNREVYEYVKTFDWTARMYEGQKVMPIENVRFEGRGVIRSLGRMIQQ